MSILDTRGFFAARFPTMAEPDRVHLRAIDRHGQVRQGWYRTPDEAAAAALRVAGRANVYYGVNPRRDHDGTKAGVTRVPALHEDVDFKHFADGEAGAWAALAAFPLPPSLVVHSGGGLQPLWSLAVSIAGDDREGIARAEAIMQRLGDRLGRLDATHDVSRIFRVAGTWNYKYDPPRPVEVVEFDPSRRYTLDEFEELLPAPPPPPRRPLWSPSAARLRPDVPSPAEIRDMLRYIPPLLPYEDWVRVAMAVHELYPGEEGRALVDEWSTTAREAHRCNGTLRRQPGKWRQFRAPGQAGNVGAGTLIWLAKQYGWRSERERPRLREREVSHARA